MKLWSVMFAFTMLWGMTAWSKQSETPQDRYKKAENIFRFQDYKKAAKQFEALLYPKPVLMGQKMILKAHEYLGACYFWLHRKKRMNEEFTAILVKKPGYKLDPFYYPVPLLDRFEALRTRLRSLGIIRGPTKQIKSSKKHVPKTKPGLKCRTLHKIVIKHSKILCYVPFGVGQFVNGHSKKGAGFLSSQVVGLGLNIGAFVAVEAMRGNDGMFSASQAHKARILRYVQYAGLGVFVASAVWGILDAIHDFKPQEVRTRVIVTPCPTGAAVGIRF